MHGPKEVDIGVFAFAPIDFQVLSFKRHFAERPVQLRGIKLARVPAQAGTVTVATSAATVCYRA